jgi:hypothetical protein
MRGCFAGIWVALLTSKCSTGDAPGRPAALVAENVWAGKDAGAPSGRLGDHRF